MDDETLMWSEEQGWCASAEETRWRGGEPAWRRPDGAEECRRGGQQARRRMVRARECAGGARRRETDFDLGHEEF